MGVNSIYYTIEQLYVNCCLGGFSITLSQYIYVDLLGRSIGDRYEEVWYGRLVLGY